MKLLGVQNVSRPVSSSQEHGGGGLQTFPPRGFAFASFTIGDADVGVYCVHLKSNLIIRGDKSVETGKNIRKREVAANKLENAV